MCPNCQSDRTFPYNGNNSPERMCSGCGRVYNPKAAAPSGKENSYYWVEMPINAVTIDETNGTIGFMLEEYIKHGLDNDFDRGNLAKANHRLGKKQGNTEEYELDKMHYYVDRIGE